MPGAAGSWSCVRAWPCCAAVGVSFRAAVADDMPFLARVYAATRNDELAPLGWSDAQRSAFIAMQFGAQHAHYQSHHAGMDRLVILVDSAAAGRLYLARGADDFSIVDIALLPEHRGRSLGSVMIRDIQAAAAAEGRGVVLHVAASNPAQRLYRRLGFGRIRSDGVHDLMRWTAGDGG